MGVLPDLPGRHSRVLIKYLAEVGCGAEVQCIADLLNGAVCIGQHGNCFFAQYLLAQSVGCDFPHLLEIFVQHSFTDTAVLGNLGYALVDISII